MSLKHDIISIMQDWAPENMAEPWDNVGLQLDTLQDILRMAVVLELNLDTWDIITEYPYDFIISHHPVIFKPLKSLGTTDWTHSILRECIKKDIGLYVSHTNLDRSATGVTDALLHQYNLDYSDVTDIVHGYGKIITLTNPVLLHHIEDPVPILAKIIPDDLTINRVAYCAGSGKSFVKDIAHKNIDLFVTGELGYHDIQYLRQQNIGVMLLGHYQSEIFVLDAIRQRMSHLELEIDVIK
jgi:dinuclear metal center YbgI/SA1388 family protein